MILINCYLIYRNKNKKDSKINFVSLTFSIERKTPKQFDKYSKRFILLIELGKLKKKEMKIVLLDNQPQELPADACGIFQLYFYKNLFEPEAGSKIINDEFLTEKTVGTLLNKTFSLNKEQNEEKIV